MRVLLCLSKDEDGPQIIGQRLHRALHIPADTVVDRLPRRICGDLVIECDFSPPACGAETHEREADDYALEPTLETSPLVVLVDRLWQPDEEIVHDVLRILHRARHASCQTKQWRRMQSVERCESVRRAGRDSMDQF